MKLFNFKKLNKERGSATIEAVISFTGFLFVIFTILNVSNFCRAQMLISNAVDTATKEITQYSYFYKMSGLQKLSEDVAGHANDGKTNLNSVVDTVGGLYSSLTGAVDNTTEHATNIKNAVDEGTVNMDDIQNTLASVKNDGTNIKTSMDSVMSAYNAVLDNPLLYMKSIIAVAGNESLNMIKSHIIAAPLARAFTIKHFGETTEEADKTLEALGVVDGIDGLNFKMSTIFSSETPEDVHIVVYYKLRIVQLFNWATLEVPMCKESVARAWLGGDNVQKLVAPMVPEVEEETTDSEQTDTGEETPEDTTEPTTEESTTEKVDITGSYWHLDANGKFMAVLDGRYGSDVGRDFLHHLSMENGYPQATQSTSETLKKDNPKQLFQSYTITSGNDDTDSSIFIGVLGGLKSIEENLEANDGDEKVERTLYYEVYVPENISEEDYNKLKEEIEEAEEKLDQHIEAVNSEGNTSGITTAKNAEYEIRIIKAGGNYDYGSETK